MEETVLLLHYTLNSVRILQKSFSSFYRLANSTKMLFVEKLHMQVMKAIASPSFPTPKPVSIKLQFTGQG